MSDDDIPNLLLPHGGAVYLEVEYRFVILDHGKPVVWSDETYTDKDEARKAGEEAYHGAGTHRWCGGDLVLRDSAHGRWFYKCTKCDELLGETEIEILNNRVEPEEE